MANQETIPQSYQYDDSATVPAHGSEIGYQAINGYAEEIVLPEYTLEPPGETAFEELAQPSAGIYLTANTSVIGTGKARTSDKDADMDEDDDK